MEEAYDLMEGLLTSKADEHLMGFAGFSRGAHPGVVASEGVLKVSAFHRPDGSGYLTLTFIQDREQGAGNMLVKPDQEAFRALLGPNFEMLIDIPLNTFADLPDYVVEELDVYFPGIQPPAGLDPTARAGLQALSGMAAPPAGLRRRGEYADLPAARPRPVRFQSGNKGFVW